MEHYNNPGQSSGALPFSLDRELIEGHLARFSNLNRRGLIDTLIPHRSLPEYDPARYIIDFHRGDEVGDAPALKSSYDLGVVFARSLVRKGQIQAGVLPSVISDLEHDKKSLVDDYLRQAAHKDIRDLTAFDDDFNRHLRRAIDLFSKRCELVVPDLLLDGNDEVVRGVHDYLSVVSLLESSVEQRKRSLKRRLGAASGVGALALLLRHRPRKTDAD